MAKHQHETDKVKTMNCDTSAYNPNKPTMPALRAGECLVKTPNGNPVLQVELKSRCLTQYMWVTYFRDSDTVEP